MIKKVFLLAGLALCIQGVAAQEKLVRFGIKAGLNVADVERKAVITTPDPKDAESQPKYSFYAGAIADFNFNAPVELETGLIYSDQGVGGSTKTNIGVLTLPILAKYNMPFLSGLAVKGGIYAGYVLSAKAEVAGVEKKLEHNALDLGLSIGAEYALPMGLFFDAAFNYGLTNTGKEDNTADTSFKVSSLKNRVFQVGVGYRF